MRTRTDIVAAVGLAAFVTAFSSRADAQSMPSVSKAKAAASNAVTATNAHTRTMEQDQAAPSRPPASQVGSKSPAVAAAAQSKAPTGAQASRNSAGGATSVSARGGRTLISLDREAFSYQAEGRRDPFLSLMSTGVLRPMISDLKLVGVVYDPMGRSVAILRDLFSKEQYRVKVGQALGRMRVAQIQPRSITFTLEELGYSRQEVLALNDSTQARTQ